jgi:hypothetical protein
VVVRVHESDPVAQLERRRRRSVQRLKAVNDALDRWAEYREARAMPDDIRPAVKRPRTDWAVLKGLQALLMDVVADFEEAWERRN